MGNIDQMVSSLQKLYSKRSALDKQIIDAEKKLAAEAKLAAKPAAPAKKPAVKARKPVEKPIAKPIVKPIINTIPPKPLLKK